MNTLTLPTELTNFLIVLVVSLLIGLSQRKHFAKKNENMHLGTDRTYTLIGLLGYAFYILQPETMVVYLVGGVALFVLIALFYSYKLFHLDQTGMTSLLIALMTYSIGPLVYKTQLWVVIMLVVSILFLNEMKATFRRFSQRLNEKEFMNLAKFLVIAGVILPVLPDEPIVEDISLSPYNIWLTTVVISGFSYFSYLLKRYVFNQSGIIVSGLLGGIYSSMATTVILTRKAASVKEEQLGQYIIAVFCSVGTLYVKYMILMAFFNMNLLLEYWHYFAIMFLTGMAVAGFFYFQDRKKGRSISLAAAPASAGASGNAQTAEGSTSRPAAGTDGEVVMADKEEEDKNPLEFQIAILFAVLFVVFTVATHYTILYFGKEGLSALAVIVGATDITPFILNLYQAKYDITNNTIIFTTFLAIISSNIIKMCYGIFLSKRRFIKQLLAGFAVITFVNVGLLLLLM